jgi:hypothetical protein
MVEGLSLVGFAIGGFFVGIGTKMGNGCTSGHGLCGMPRFSLRSWVAVITFFGVALLTANFLNASVVKLDTTQPSYVSSDMNMVLTGGIAAGISLFLLILVGLFYVRTAVKYYEVSLEGICCFCLINKILTFHTHEISKMCLFTLQSESSLVQGSLFQEWYLGIKFSIS